MAQECDREVAASAPHREVKKLVTITTGKTLPLDIELAGGIDRGPTRTY